MGVNDGRKYGAELKLNESDYCAADRQTRALSCWKDSSYVEKCIVIFFDKQEIKKV